MVIRTILNLFIYLFFLQEDFTRTKSIKSIKSTKSTKRKQTTFLLLDVFYAHKYKKHKKHKTQTSGFLPLRCFYAHINAVFFGFCSLVCVLCFFVCVKSSCKKKIKRFKIAFITSFILLLTCTPLNLPMESYFF